MSMQQGPPFQNGATALPQQMSRQQHIAALNEDIWAKIGQIHEVTGDLDNALYAYEQALRHDQWSTRNLNAISCILRAREKYPEAMDFLKNVLKVEPANGEAWGNLGHCYLMMDNLQEAYTAYQQALYYLPDPKEPKLWYGIGILYDRYGSLEHAEEAFSQVMRMQPDFEKANEIYFRLGIIYKQQQKFQQSLECFTYIVLNPPKPLNEEDIWFQIGHVHEQQKDYESAKRAYRKVLERDPKHAKVLQQLGWLHHQQSNSYTSQDQAIEYLEQSVSSDNQDAQSWYLLGRCYMAQQKFPKAYEAYQQAVYRDGRNPTFWCSIGVLYYQINQYRDALDAYSRAIRLNPYISEVWYDLGTLYESCNNQTSDALDAYARAAELDPSNTHIKARLQLLRNGGAAGPNQHNAPVPQDVHPQAYQNGVGVPPGPQWGMQSAPNQQAQPPPLDTGRANDWTRGLAGIQQLPQGPMPQPNAYDQRDIMRAPPLRQPSPRQDAPRGYSESARPPPVRKHSPSPKLNPAMPGSHQTGFQSLPQIGMQERGPSFGASGRPQTNGGPPPTANGGPASGNLPPYGRPFSPVTELRPLREERPPTPGGGYPQQQYHHQPFSSISTGPAGIANGAPPPAAALAAAEAAARERDDRPPSAMKRSREWEGESGPSKKIANEETRARLEDHSARRPSPPGPMSASRDHYRRGSSEIRRENERRAHENYHPSEAAHHPYAAPAQIPSMQNILEAPKEDRKDLAEPPARKMEVDEDYDNNSEDDKRGAGTGPRSSPQSGPPPTLPKQEATA